MEALAELAAKGWEVRQRHFPPTLRLAYPIQTKAISVTGTACELNCAHCGGAYLRHMKPLSDIEDGEKKLGTSCLVSGGCDGAGRVPLMQHVSRLMELKQERRYNIHVGLVDDAELATIAYLADKVSFDMVGDDTTIREVFGLDRTVDDYADCYRKLRACCAVVPHICIGLHGGEIRGEYRALEILEQLGADSVTFIIFTPTKGTRFAECAPPNLAATVELLATAREKFAKVPLQLGCMRPGGRYREAVDQWAVRTGINAIVNPAPAAVRLAEELGLTIVRQWECCVL